MGISSYFAGKSTLTGEHTAKGASKIETLPEESLTKNGKEDIDGEEDKEEERQGNGGFVEGEEEASVREGACITNEPVQIQVNLEHWESHKMSECVHTVCGHMMCWSKCLAKCHVTSDWLCDHS